MIHACVIVTSDTLKANNAKHQGLSQKQLTKSIVSEVLIDVGLIVILI